MDKKMKKKPKQHDAEKKEKEKAKIKSQKVQAKPPTAVKPTDMPAIQSKETLLLDYDHNQQFTKRNVISNWDRYAESSDDEDNGQMSAADFEQILSASKSIGDHFTFASERSWLQNDETASEANSAMDLFKLNVGNLKNGVEKLPFYIRHGYGKENFTQEELTDMDYRAQFFGNSVTTKPAVTKNAFNQNLLNILTDRKVESSSKAEINKKAVKIDDADPLEELLSKTSIASKSVQAPVAKIPINQPQAVPASSKQVKTADIQDWLDDILNE